MSEYSGVKSMKNPSDMGFWKLGNKLVEAGEAASPGSVSDFRTLNWKVKQLSGCDVSF